jgi:predicted ferric reductase
MVCGKQVIKDTTHHPGRKSSGMDHTDAVGARNRELSNRFVGEARPGGGGSQSAGPYHAPWYAGAAWGALLCAVYPLLILSPLLAFAVLSPHSHRPQAAELGVDCAVVAFTVIALQFVITARLRWIEAPFGLDVLLQFHRAMAFVATGLLCLHPLLVASGEGWTLLTRWQARWPLWAGRSALLLLVAHVAAAIFRRALRLRYEAWRRLHNTVAFSLLGLAALHSLTLGGDLKSPAARAVWASLLLVAIGAWFYGHFVRRRLLRRAPYRVMSVTREAPRVWTVTLEPSAGRPLQYVPGQFQFLRPHGDTFPGEEHPFSIASSPSPDGRISLTIKESGDFTAAINRIKPGDLVTVHGPFGRFSHVFYPDAADLVFVAAGVGITPLMSMLRYMRDRQEARRVQLVYANRGVADIVFRGELESIQSDGFPALTTVHVLSQPPADWDGATGRLNTESLRLLCGGFSGKMFFICCPPAMALGLIRGLEGAGVGPERIQADYFGL